MAKKPANAPLSARIENDQLVISIGVSTLAFAAMHSPEAFMTGWVITDKAGFAKDVLHEMEREEENGSTPISRMLDNAMQTATEQGCQHIEEAR